MEDDRDGALGKRPCPSCQERGGDRSGNNLVIYADHGHCFACGHHPFWDGGDMGETLGDTEDYPRAAASDLLKGETRAIPSRKLTAETCRRYGYIIGRSRDGQIAHIAPYRDASGAVVGQKLRIGNDKAKMPWVGRNKGLQLFGQHLQGKGRMVVVTEGELDALSASQALGNKWPVVSVINGSGGAKKDILTQLEWIKGFEKVVLCLDADDPGREATDACARALMPVVPVHVCQLPLKDASDMLQADRGEELARLIFDAPRFRPSGILRVADVRPMVRERPVMGKPWPWAGLTRLTYGRREGEIHCLGAGVGVGKTDLMSSCQAHDVTQLGLRTAVFSSEQTPAEVLRAMASKVAGKRFNVPDASWTEQELDQALDQLTRDDLLVIYDRRQDFSWETLRETIRYLAAGEGFKSFYLDNLTAVVAHADDERRALDGLMEEAAGLGVEYGLLLHLVSHLTTAEGRAHEEGGRVLEKQFTGSRAIARWSHFMYGLERDKQAEDPTERNTSTLRCLKDRNTGNSTGATLRLVYDGTTGLMNEEEAALPIDDGEVAF